MATTIENFVFRKEWRDALKGYPSEVRAEVYEAIMAYAFEGETIEMCDLARMAFNFIKLQLDSMREIYRKKCDRNRESANRRWGKRDDANGCEQMQTDANGCEGIRMDANGCEAMRSDAINSNQINSNQNNISLSLSLSGENDKAELTEEERKKIFEFFYWEKNLKYAKEETERFIAHYEANGWCRGNSDKPVKSKVALAKLWDVKLQETRWPKKVNDWLHILYRTAKKVGLDANKLYGIEKIEMNSEATILYCTRDIATLIDACIQESQVGFGRVIYRVKKINN